LLGINDGSQNGMFDALSTGPGMPNAHYSQNQGVPINGGDSPTASQFWAAYVVSDAGTLTLGTATTPVLLAVVTIDTTGFAGQTFALKLDSSNQVSNFTDTGGDHAVTIVDGFITVGSQAAPEPACLGLLTIGAAGFLLRRRRSPSGSAAA
jgi:hypothetical protein